MIESAVNSTLKQFDHDGDGLFTAGDVDDAYKWLPSAYSDGALPPCYPLPTGTRPCHSV